MLRTDPVTLSVIPGSSASVLPNGVLLLDARQLVFDGMLEGWDRQQASRLLSPTTIRRRGASIRRFQLFTGEYPWKWTASDVEDFTTHLVSGDSGASHSTIRGLHNDLALFCEFICDPRYGWANECFDRFGDHPIQICYEWNTARHLGGFDGRASVRALSVDELQRLFDCLDDRAERIADSNRKGTLSAIRDAVLFKVIYAYGLRRTEAVQLDLTDWGPNPAVPKWGRFGSILVRHGKASRGGPPKRRRVVTIPEFDWVVESLGFYFERVRPHFDPDHPGSWLTERRTRVSAHYLDQRFAQVRDSLGLDRSLHPHCLRHSYVTHLVEFGYPERFVQEQVGHAYASTTAIYANVGDDFKNQILTRALERLDTRQETT